MGRTEELEKLNVQVYQEVRDAIEVVLTQYMKDKIIENNNFRKSETAMVVVVGASASLADLAAGLIATICPQTELFHDTQCEVRKQLRAVLTDATNKMFDKGEPDGEGQEA